MHRTAVWLTILATGLGAANLSATGQTPSGPTSAVPAAAEPAWVVRSNQYTQMLLDVQFFDASQLVFGGLRTLLDDQVAADRRPAAVARLRKYAGVEPGFKPFTDVLKQRVIEQMAKPGVVYPSVGEMETKLGRNKNYV